MQIQFFNKHGTRVSVSLVCFQSMPLLSQKLLNSLVPSYKKRVEYNDRQTDRPTTENRSTCMDRIHRNMGHIQAVSEFIGHVFHKNITIFNQPII